MDNLGATITDDDEKKPASGTSSPKTSTTDAKHVYKSNDTDLFRYNAEKKALEALDSCVVSVSVSSLSADKPYAGMGKEELLRFSRTPFWNRFRMACTVVFWLAWLALLAAVIVLIVTFPQCKPPPEKPWYETSVIYQIYVRSFYDSDGDGIGDINGIRSKLGYLESIDTDAILLSSIYESHPDELGGGSQPADYGYEVIDHKKIEQTYGTMADLEALLTEAHELGIKVIMDFIPNYTGTNHPWFVSSRQNGSVSNPEWNYYVWINCESGPPNNWLTVYSQSMWQGDFPRNSTIDQCFLHQFLDTQAELNLRSSAVQQELEDILRFWLDKGVDGFRVITIKHLFEDADLRNEPQNQQCTDSYECYDHIYTTSQEEIYPLVAKWRSILDEYSSPDNTPRVLLTDAMDTINNSLRYYGDYGPDGAHLPLNYELTKLNTSCNGRCVYDLIDPWIYAVPSYGTMNWMTGTQDMRRIADVIPQDSSDDWGYQNAVTMLKMTLPGAALVYYGEEIGMVNVNSTTTEGSKDPAGNISLVYSRDPFRSPMQWTTEPDAGFVNDTGSNDTLPVDPWLPVGTNLYNISVQAQNGTGHTPFTFYSELASLRRNSESLQIGDFHYTLLTDDLMSYYREYEGQDRYLVAINFGAVGTFDLAGSHFDVPDEAEVVLTTRGTTSVSAGDAANMKQLKLEPGDGVIVKWEYVRPDGKPKSF